MKVFPTCLFAPNGTDAYIERRVISGGTAINGDETLIETSGGGRVALELSDFDLDDPEVARAWDAIDAYMDGGVRPMIVPWCDPAHQPSYHFDGVPHSDDTSFSDGTLYHTGGTSVSLSADVALGATILQIDITLLKGNPLGWFSINHDVIGHRAYKVAEILAQTDTTATISVRPRLRRATSAGATLDFEKPRCVMRIVGEMRAPRTMGYAEGQPLRFVEYPTGSYE